MGSLKRTMGRPPANWVYALAQLGISKDSKLTAEEVGILLGTTTIAVKNFCRKANLEGDYKKDIQSGTIKKYYSLKELRQAAEGLVSGYKG